MADGIKNNIFLVNAPAGSGKTTTIRRMVERHLRENPNDNIPPVIVTMIIIQILFRNNPISSFIV